MKKILALVVALAAMAAHAQTQPLLYLNVQQPLVINQCAYWFAVTPVPILGSQACGGGSGAFNSITSGTNTTAAMVVSTGASLAPSGSGTISATNTTAVNGAAVAVSASIAATNSSGQIIAATTTGSGNAVEATSPTLVTPNLGTPSTLVLTNATGLPNASVIGLGTFATQNYATPPAIGGTTPAAGSFSALTDTAITGLIQCVHASSAGVFTGTGSDCGSGGSTAFSGLTSGTNTTMAALVGTGASLGPTGSGTVNANQVNGAAPATSAFLASTNSSGQVIASSAATQTVPCNGTGSTGAYVACTLGGNLVATATGLTTSQPINAQTGTSYAMLTTDAGKLVTLNNASAVAVSLSQATTTGFTAGYSFDVEDLGAGTVTITPATSTINGASTLTVAQNTGCTVTSDGTNYQVSACTAVAPSGGGSGTVNSGTSGHLTYYASSTNTVSSAPNATISAGAVTLGASGTAGSLTMGNATSGTLTVQPVTGALGAVTASLPANTGTVAETNLAETFSALQTFGTNISIGGVTAAGATGTGNVVYATSPILSTPALGTPSALVLTNATSLPCAALPAFTGDTTSSAGSCAQSTVKVNGGAVPASAAVAATNSSSQIIAATTVSYLIDAGTQFTVAGTGACATTTKTGTTGTATGRFSCTGTTGASTFTITLPTTTNGWDCHADDRTTPANSLTVGTDTTTSFTFSATTITSSDVIRFFCMGS